MNLVSQAVEPISPIMGKPPSSLEFDTIHTDDNNNELYTSSYYILPKRQLLFAPVVE